MKLFFIAALYISVFFIPEIIEAKENVVKEDDGFLYNKIGNSAYVVDPNAQLCFIKRYGSPLASFTLIPCSNLKKRSEWKEIITWEN